SDFAGCKSISDQTGSTPVSFGCRRALSRFDFYGRERDELARQRDHPTASSKCPLRHELIFGRRSRVRIECHLAWTLITSRPTVVVTLTSISLDRATSPVLHGNSGHTLEVIFEADVILFGNLRELNFNPKTWAAACHFCS